VTVATIADAAAPDVSSAAVPAAPVRTKGADGDGSSTFLFGGLALQAIAPPDAVGWVVARALRGERAVVVTSNINHLRLLHLFPDFRAVVGGCELNVADGWPLVAASRLIGTPVPGRVAGIDLVREVLMSAPPLRLAILGGPPNGAERLAQRVSTLHNVVLVDPLPKGSWETEPALRSLSAAVEAAAPNLALVGIGPPRQELLANRLRSAVRGPVICCGASIEVLAGLRPRAPRALQTLGLEWAFRLALEPRRLFSRYMLSGGWFMRVLVRETLRSGAARLSVRNGSGLAAESSLEAERLNAQ
jgi:N-acetylglucosaminyldiphosphoundecaprenol N-acetyl-beta-D-mannosaminyltransferase